MRTIHAVDGSLTPNEVKTIMLNHSLNVLLIVNPEPDRSYHPLERNITVELEDDTLSLSKKILQECRSISENFSLKFCLDTENHLIIFAFCTLATVLDCETYSIRHPKIEFPKMQIQKLSEHEALFILTLANFGGISDSLGKIAKKCNWGEDNDPKAVQKASYVANKLRKIDLIELDKEGRKVKVIMLEKAKVYTELVF